MNVGLLVGIEVRIIVGDDVNNIVGLFVTIDDGIKVRIIVGGDVNSTVGLFVTIDVGIEVRIIVGDDVGSDTFDDGISVGNIDGKIDGIMVG